MLRWFSLAISDTGLLLLKVIQGAVIGRLTSRFTENSLLLLSVGISSVVGLAQVNWYCKITHPVLFFIFSFSNYGTISDVSISFVYVCVLCVFQAMMTNVFQFCLIVIPMMFSLSVFNVITDSMLTKSVSPSDTGNLRTQLDALLHKYT